MEQIILCPRTEICPVYRAYVDHTGDDSHGVIRVTNIENTDYYVCKVLSAVLKLIKDGFLPEDTSRRLKGITDCLLIDQTNRIIMRHEPDI